MSKRLFLPLMILGSAMFAYAPFMIVGAPYESTMGLVQKIFYFHAPIWHGDVHVGVRLRHRQRHLSVRAPPFGRPCRHRCRGADRDVSGSSCLITGPLWARKAWGVWWQWDARLTSSLVLG